MATIEKFEDVEAWQKARKLADKVFLLSQANDFFKKDFGLKDQITRSSGSIMDNIAEGFERGGKKEFIQFLGYAKGSAGETRSQLYRALDRKYIDNKDFKLLHAEATNISKMLNGLIKYLKNSDMKGFKYH